MVYDFLVLKFVETFKGIINGEFIWWVLFCKNYVLKKGILSGGKG